MAGLNKLVSTGVAIADKVTGGRNGVQCQVTHMMWTGQDAYTQPTYDVVLRDAVVEKKQRLIRTRDKQEVLSKHYLGFLRPIAPNGAAEREEPIDPRDVFVLPDGSTGTLLDWTGFLNRATGRPYLAEVWLG